MFLRNQWLISEVILKIWMEIIMMGENKWIKDKDYNLNSFMFKIMKGSHSQVKIMMLLMMNKHWLKNHV